MSFRGVDCETFPITSTNPCPTVVCLAAAKPNGSVKLLERRRARGLLNRLLDGADVLVGANLPYDVAVTMKQWPETIPKWFQAMEDRRLSDVRIREALDLLATVGDPDAGKGGVHSLAQLARRHVGLNVDGEKTGPDAWRLRFHELDGLRSEDYPDAAARYVKQDADLACQVAMHQKTRRPEWLHVNAAVCYYLKTVRGLKVDVEAKETLQAQVEAALHPDKLPLLFKPLNGFPALVTPALPERSGLTKAHAPDCRRPAANSKTGPCKCPMRRLAPVPASVAVKDVLTPRILAACVSGGIKVPRNKPTAAALAKDPDALGSVKTDEDCLKLVSPFDPVLEQYQTYKSLDKLRKSYFPALEWPFGSGITARRVFCGYDYVKKTGRGSGRGNSKKNKDKALYPSVAIQLADPRVRKVYVPTGPTRKAPKGYVFAVADYSAIDLCCLAQTIKDLYGSSTLLDQINAGINPHTFLATVLAFENDRKFARTIEGFSEDDAYKEFLSHEKDPVDKHTVDHVAGVCKCPNWFKRWRDLSKKVGLGFAGGMGLDTMISLCRKEIRLTITREEARRYREIWFKVYPEMRWYLRKWVPAQKDYTGDWLGYTSTMGMRRVRCSYMECANGRALQTPAAEGMKLADWLVTRACYDVTRGDVLFGCYPVINMHDELVLEIPVTDPDTMHAQAKRLEELMVEGMQQVLPDVKVEAKPFLTTRWVKDAKQVVDKRGRIRVWSPEEN